MTKATSTVGQRLANWSTPVLILLIFAPAIWAIHVGRLGITGKPTRDLLWLIVAMNVLIFVWVRAFSNIRLAKQALVIILFLSAQIGLLRAIRLDGFAGDGRPIWVWAWSPTAEEVFAESRRRSRDDNESEPSVVDLSKITPWDCLGFRGADRTGRMNAATFSNDWKTQPPKLLWRQPIGLSWSSFAVVGDYCITQEQREQYEVVACYKLRTGREVWVHRDEARFEEVTSGVGPRATPTIHNGRVYALGATGILNCLDGATGESIWSVNILADNNVENCIFGMTNSPLVVDSLVIVTPGGNGSSLAAYDIESGQRVWAAGDAGASYSSSQLAELCGQRQVLNFNAEGLYSHDLRSGNVLWNIPWVSNPAERNNVCQPVVIPGDRGLPDRMTISSGYGQGSAMFSITRDGEEYSFHEQWATLRLQAKFSSVILHDDHIYGLDGGFLTCLDARNGRRMWKGGRYGYGQLVSAGAMLLVQCESGDVVLVEPSANKHREVARLPALTDRTWNHPVVAGRYLLVRNDREAACFELPGNRL